MPDFDGAIILVVGVAFAIAMTYTLLRSPSHEPPSVSSKIPFVGHLIGLMQHGSNYFSMLSEKYPEHPIFTVNIFSFKTYVISSPIIMRAVQKQPEAVKFEPLLELIQERLCRTSSEKLAQLRDKHSGEPSIYARLEHDMIPALAGKSLDTMNKRMLRLLLPLIDGIGDEKTIDLFGWIRHAITVVSTDAIYGNLNPFENQLVEDAFWELESNLAGLLINIAPWVTASKAWEARKFIGDIFSAYFDLSGHENSSELLAVRYRHFHKAGFTNEEIAYSEIPMMLGLLANTIPAAFWFHFELFSRTKLLEDIREEIERKALKITPDGTHIIDLVCLRDVCPLLIATYQEVLRTRSTTVPVRFVTKDLVLADKYLLKSGSMLCTPAKQLGRDSNAWGTSADKFDEQRFLNYTATCESPGNNKKNIRRTGGFMAFGVTPVICPGRHFATSEILALIAMMVVRYDIFPVTQVWDAPPRRELVIVGTTCPVDGPFYVTLKTRQKYAGRMWQFRFTEGQRHFIFPLG